MRHRNGLIAGAGKRLAKRSIIGTRVCAPSGDDGKLCAGIIAAVKTAADGSETGYSIRFDDGTGGRREYRATELVGPGFQTLSDLRLMAGQRVYITFNGREISGDVVVHRPDTEEVRVSIMPHGHEGSIEVIKKLDDVRVLESRKSARLMDQDTDFARLADMSDRKRSSSSQNAIEISGSRKRRPSSSQDQDESREEEMKDEDDDNEPKEEEMTECTAALVLMSLSCSPHSPSIQGRITRCQQPESLSTSPSTSSEGAFSCRSSPSPPLSESSSSAAWSGRGLPSVVDEGIGLTDDDFEDVPKRKKSDCRTVFQCTWPGCVMITTTVASIELHVRQNHLGPRLDKSLSDDCTNDSIDDHEEEFYYTEVELGAASSPPTLSHRDMARPPHEDPEYQKTLIIPRPGSACPMNIPSVPGNNAVNWPFASLNGQKQIKMMYQNLGGPRFPSSPMRKARGETKKCRKVYGMEHREKWCTQCKWKKACTRFVGSLENAQLA
ncbi:zinc finger protein 395-like isoform X2 [Rhopalosiphum maidis]|uniref:zinc finger protein 395-like isoform X2 n=1 Tax=Rhopalosiphum maidis TaxID=43146 RepID=UPI000F00D706|nr:zinc finger protein 395-like isoform X2 [Rhopalosiphum maidis]